VGERTRAVALGKRPLYQNSGRKERMIMRRFLSRCWIWVIALVLAGGIFYYFWEGRDKDFGDTGTLVRRICREARQTMRL